MDSGSWEEINFNRPITGRKDSFANALDLLLAMYHRPIVIVETGCIRNTTEESRFGDGWSTLNWEWFAKLTDSSVYVVDIDANHLEKAKQVVPESQYVTYKQQDSIEFLKNFHRPIDFLFLDSYDYCGDEENIRKCHEHQLSELKAVWDKLNDNCFVLIDDVFSDSWDGKGKLSIPYLIENGFRVLYFMDSQVLLFR